jgi:hypothetical protein
MGIIPSAIGQTWFEKIRDRIGAIIYDELYQQNAINYTDDLSASVWIDRVVPFSHADIRHGAINIVFGGVDYFEVTIFAEHEFYLENTSIEAVFHENYAIEYVKNINFALYNRLNNRIIFDRLYTYGPPATRILRAYTLEACGPRPMAMPRLASMENDEEFNRRLAKIDHQTFGQCVVLLAFPGSEYLAPLCFTATLLEFIRLGRETTINTMVKFKNHRTAVGFKKQTSPMDCHIQWIDNGSIENLVWKAGFTVVFNSISLYEALLGPTIIIIPAFLDSMHDENLLQETPSSVRELCGELKSVRFASEVSEIYQIIKSIQCEKLLQIVIAERDARKKLVRRKFYLHQDVAMYESIAKQL